jgi:hypothetical protein
MLLGPIVIFGAAGGVVGVVGAGVFPEPTDPSKVENISSNSFCLAAAAAFSAASWSAVLPMIGMLASRVYFTSVK